MQSSAYANFTLSRRR